MIGEHMLPNPLCTKIGLWLRHVHHNYMSLICNTQISKSKSCQHSAPAKSWHKLRTFQRTRGQIIDNDNQCHYCEGNFTHYTDHYIIHCPVTIRYRERLYTDIQHHQGSTSTRTSNIMKTQAARQHKELITLLGKFPIIQ